MAESGIAVDLGGTKVAFGIVSARGVVRKRIVEPVDREAAVDQIVRLVRDLEGEARAQPAIRALTRLVELSSRSWKKMTAHASG